MGNEPLLTIERLRMSYRGAALVLDGIDLGIGAGETVGLAGASGSGKSTLARIVLRLLEPDSGAVRFAGKDLLGLRGKALRAVRPNLQMVFQDTIAAFNPRATVAKILDDPLRVNRLMPRANRRVEVRSLLARVRLPAEILERRPHELSGGQRQRVAIARALATRPRLIVLDEPVSSLDVSVRGQILNLLADIKAESGVAYLFISHDLAVVRAVADRVVIIEGGRIVEEGAPETVFRAPAAEATRHLVAAVPRIRR